MNYLKPWPCMFSKPWMHYDNLHVNKKPANFHQRGKRVSMTVLQWTSRWKAHSMSSIRREVMCGEGRKTGALSSLDSIANVDWFDSYWILVLLPQASRLQTWHSHQFLQNKGTVANTAETGRCSCNTVVNHEFWCQHWSLQFWEANPVSGLMTADAWGQHLDSGSLYMWRENIWPQAQDAFVKIN